MVSPRGLDVVEIKVVVWFVVDYTEWKQGYQSHNS